MYKAKILIPILFCFFILPLLAFSITQEAQIFNRANEYYSSKDYINALKLYSDLIERGIKNPYLFYNLGNTYYKLNRMGYSILYFERALSLKPFDREIRDNLSYVRRSLQEPVVPQYNEGVFRYFYLITSYIRPNALIYLELSFFTFFMTFLFLYIFIPVRGNRLKKQVITFLTLFLFFLGIASVYDIYEKRYPKAIVTEKKIEVKGAPIAESEVLFTLHEGVKTKLREIRGDWVYIYIADGREGWIPAESIEFIEL